jgi:hypothetical protein
LQDALAAEFLRILQGFFSQSRVVFHSCKI